MKCEDCVYYKVNHSFNYCSLKDINGFKPFDDCPFVGDEAATNAVNKYQEQFYSSIRQNLNELTVDKNTNDSSNIGDSTLYYKNLSFYCPFCYSKLVYGFLTEAAETIEKFPFCPYCGEKLDRGENICIITNK